jgi:hypothetical protein
MTRLTDDQRAVIAQYARAKTALDSISDALHALYAPEFEAILAHNDTELDEEFEELVPPSYWQFETRCRLRALRKLDHKLRRNNNIHP